MITNLPIKCISARSKWRTFSQDGGESQLAWKLLRHCIGVCQRRTEDGGRARAVVENCQFAEHFASAEIRHLGSSLRHLHPAL